MITEFKEFINRGNFVELAVAFVMGVAVTNVVNAIVDDFIMPLIAWVFGEPNFNHILMFNNRNGSVGAVFTALFNFVLIALVVFLIVYGYNRMNRARRDEPEPEAEPEDVVLLREIRDALVARGGTAPPPGGTPVDGR